VNLDRSKNKERKLKLNVALANKGGLHKATFNSG